MPARPKLTQQRSFIEGKLLVKLHQIELPSQLPNAKLRCQVKFDDHESTKHFRTSVLGEMLELDHSAQFNVDKAASIQLSVLADEDQLVGAVAIPPDFVQGTVLSEEWLDLESPASSTPSLSDSATSTSGKLQCSVEFFSDTQEVRLSATDFDVIKTLGRGGYGVVYKVRRRDDAKCYAMKKVKKKYVTGHKDAEHIIAERQVLSEINSPWIVRLKWAFQTKHDLFFVMQYKSGGELFKHLAREGGRFEESKLRFYIAEIILALEELHRNSIAYRDLKPENILLDHEGHVCLCDLGLAKVFDPDAPDEFTKTCCGSVDYLAPELLKNEEGYNSRILDWYTLGVLIYEMHFGYTPFCNSADRFEQYEKIINNEPRMPKRGITEEGRDLVMKLLEKDPLKRLGATNRDAQEVKEHPFFAEIDWKEYEERRATPPFVPPPENDNILSPEETAHVLQGVTRLPMGDSVTTDSSSCKSRRNSVLGTKNGTPGGTPGTQTPEDSPFKGFTFCNNRSSEDLRKDVTKPKSRSNSINRKNILRSLAITSTPAS